MPRQIRLACKPRTVRWILRWRRSRTLHWTAWHKTCRHGRAYLQRHYAPVLRLQPARRQDFGRHPGALVVAGNVGRNEAPLRLHQGFFRDGLHRGPQKVRCANHSPSWRRRSDRADRRVSSDVREDCEERQVEGISRFSARDARNPCGPDQCRPAGVLQAKQGNGCLSLIRPSLATGKAGSSDLLPARASPPCALCLGSCYSHIHSVTAFPANAAPEAHVMCQRRCSLAIAFFVRYLRTMPARNEKSELNEYQWQNSFTNIRRA